jgi:hypothetical protein
MADKEEKVTVPKEFEKIISYMMNSWVFISDDNMYEMRDIHMPTETREMEQIMSSITGTKYEVR